MTDFRLADLHPILLEKVITKLEPKSYFRIQQTCRGMHDFIRRNKNISIHLDGNYCFPKIRTAEVCTQGWVERPPSLVFDENGCKLQFLGLGYWDIFIAELYGTRLPFLSVNTDPKYFDRTCDCLRKYRITAENISFSYPGWSKGEILVFLSIVKPRKVTLCRELCDGYEVLLQSKTVKTLEVELRAEDVVLMTPKLLLAFSDVVIIVYFPENHFDLLRASLQPNMSSITIVCPNLRRHTVKVTPGTLLRTVVEEACLKSGYDVNCCEAKNQNKKVDLALPFRLSGLANNATLELSVISKPTSENVELALQLPDGRRELLTIQLSTTLKDVLTNFATKLNEDLISDSGGNPCCIYMGRKYVGPELEHTTLLSMGITGGKSLLRYQKVEISDEELAKLKEKAVVEQKRIASLSTAYNTAKKQNEERDRIEAERLAKFEAEMKIKAEEEETRRQKEREAAEKKKEEENKAETTTNGNMDVQEGSSQIHDRLPEMPARSQNGGGWSFDSPFAPSIDLGYPDIAPPPPNRIERLNALLERMDRSIATGGSDNIVQIVAESGRMSLNQLETASNVMDTEPAPEGPVFDDPCPRNVVIFNRIEQDKQDPATATDVPDEFFEVGVDDVKSLQRDLKNQVRLQTQRSLLPRTFLEKKNRELKSEAWRHSVIRLAIGDQLIQVNFKSGEPVARIFEEVSKVFKTKTEFSLTAILNEPVKNDDTKNFIDSNLAPKSTLTVKVKGAANPVLLLKEDIRKCSHTEAADVSKEWLSINSTFKPYTGAVTEEERPVKRSAAADYPSGSKPAAPAAMSDELSADLLAKYKAEDEFARQRIAEGKPFIDNGWDSNLERGGHTFGRTGFGDSLNSSRRFRRPVRRNNNLLKTRRNPNWGRNPEYSVKFNQEYQVHTNESFIKDFQCPGNWISKICERQDDVDCFETEIKTLYDDSKASEEESIKKELFRKTIEGMINKYDQELELHWDAQVFQTGSSISGLAATGSDVDLCIFIPNASKSIFCERVNSFRILQIVRHLLLLQKEKGVTEDFPFALKEITLRDAMIPIIKIFTECDLESDLSACCDPFLSGVHNSILIKGYTEFDPRFAPLAMFVKAWAAKTKLKQPIRPKAKFNSYAITMLLIHFLQCGVDPPVLPNLRHKCGPGFYATSQDDFPVKLDVRKMPKPTIGPDTIPNLMSLPELFIRFCLYYSNFDYYRWYISLKESKVGLRRDRSDIRSFVRCYIEDPIDQHNPGRTLHDLQGARFIFRNTANAFRHAVYHPDHFPTVQQILTNQMFANGRYLLIAKTKNPIPRFKIVKGEVILPSIPEDSAIPTVTVEDLRPEQLEPQNVGDSEIPEVEVTAPPGVVIPKDYEFDDEFSDEEEDVGNEEEEVDVGEEDNDEVSGEVE